MAVPLLITRRCAILGATAASLLAPAAPAAAIVPEPYHALMRRVMGLTWAGQSRTPSNQFEGGEFVSGVGMQFRLDPDWSFEGTMFEVMKLEGSEYKGVYAITGECWVIADKAGLSIYRMKVLSGTPLPAPYEWSTSKGEFRFYNDSDRPGHFTMQGMLTDDVDRTQFRVELTDRD